MSKADWPAFPAMHYELLEHEHGLTLRDYFAAKAMQSLILVKADGSWEDIVQRSWDCADVMIEMREGAK